MGLTADVAERVTGFRLCEVESGELAVARQCLLDWIGVSVAARDEALVGILLAQVVEEGNAGDHPVLGHDLRLSAGKAALVNGTIGHALDYDDVLYGMGHPTAPIAPAILVAGRRVGASGSDVLAAFIVAVDIAYRIGRFLGPSHYAVGWHSTGTLGALGAAAACARLYGCTSVQVQHALGIAATQAAGLKCMFGSMSKPLHAGRAAEAGLFAADLARRGFTSSPEALESEQGFGQTHSAGVSVEAAMARPERMHIRDVLFKYHAACYHTHSAMEAAVTIRGRDVASHDIDHVEIHVSPAHLQTCNIAEPKTGLQTKFSLRASVGLVLLGEDTANEALFSDATAGRADLVELCGRMSVIPSMPGRMSRIVVAMRDGRVFEETRDAGIVEADLLLQQARIETKFRRLGAGYFSDANASRLLDAVAHLEEAENLDEILRLVSGPTRVASL